MANRHERRKAAKVRQVEVRMTPVNQFHGSLCAWEGCSAVSDDPAKDGWSSMLMYKGKMKQKFEAIDPRLMLRDCALCPERSNHLDEPLLNDIFGCLRTTAGRA